MGPHASSEKGGKGGKEKGKEEGERNSVAMVNVLDFILIGPKLAMCLVMNPSSRPGECQVLIGLVPIPEPISVAKGWNFSSWLYK